MKKIESICVVDDDEIYHFTINKQLEYTKLVNKIITFYNGEDAIRFFEQAIRDQKGIPDVILLDINMPVMDGWEFLKQYILLKPFLSKKVIIYLVSSSVYERDVEKAKKISEVTDYIIKPVTKESLIKILENNMSN